MKKNTCMRKKDKFFNILLRNLYSLKSSNNIHLLINQPRAIEMETNSTTIKEDINKMLISIVELQQLTSCRCQIRKIQEKVLEN